MSIRKAHDQTERETTTHRAISSKRIRNWQKVVVGRRNATFGEYLVHVCVVPLAAPCHGMPKNKGNAINRSNKLQKNFTWICDDADDDDGGGGGRARRWLSSHSVNVCICRCRCATVAPSLNQFRVCFSLRAAAGCHCALSLSCRRWFRSGASFFFHRHLRACARFFSCCVYDADEPSKWSTSAAKKAEERNVLSRTSI